MPIGLIFSLGFLWISKRIAVDSSELNYKTLMFAKKKTQTFHTFPLITTTKASVPKSYLDDNDLT